MSNFSSFKAYDIRGRVPDELDTGLARDVGRAFVGEFAADSVVVGYDMRLSSGDIRDALTAGITEAGADVLDIGLCGTEEVYFATSHLEAGGGIMITASHNPADYNGMKMVRAGSVPVSADSGLGEIRARIEQGDLPDAVTNKGVIRAATPRGAYIEHLLGYLDPAKLEGMKIVVNPGNGCAGVVMTALEPELPAEFIGLQEEPDGTFPNGVPNPMLEENRKVTADAVTESGAELGIAWDGDFDRCFFFDNEGGFVEGYYIVGALAQAFLQKADGKEKIVHDPRLTWNTIDIVEQYGGIPVVSKSGHAFIKETMRKENALYGGEMSAHHYFRDFFYCDSGMVPWLLVAALIRETGASLAELVAERKQLFPISGEINRRVKDADTVIDTVRERYAGDALDVSELDGIALEFEDWRFNLRASNTEPLVRLNVESRGDRELMQARTREILALLEEHAA